MESHATIIHDALYFIIQNPNLSVQGPTHSVPSPIHDSEIWYERMQTCSNLFTLGLTPVVVDYYSVRLNCLNSVRFNCLTGASKT